MFGGLAFLLDGSMSVGVVGDELLVRVGAERHERALARPHARIMDFTGRPMKGWVFVARAGFEDDADLASWLAWGIDAAGQGTKEKRKPPASTSRARPPGAASKRPAKASRPEAAKK